MGSFSHRIILYLIAPSNSKIESFQWTWEENFFSFYKSKFLEWEDSMEPFLCMFNPPQVPILIFFSTESFIKSLIFYFVLLFSLKFWENIQKSKEYNLSIINGGLVPAQSSPKFWNFHFWTIFDLQVGVCIWTGDSIAIKLCEKFPAIVNNSHGKYENCL